LFGGSMADTYVKLFHAILTSSIWSEDDKTRIMWVTILALADRDGYVSGTIPGLASMARMGVEDAEAAIGKLAAPDKYSRTPDHDGRRIEPTAGGWRVINYVAYRELGTAEVRRSKAAERVAKFRERQKEGCNAGVTLRNAGVTQCNGDVTLSPIPYTLSLISPENREGMQGETAKPPRFVDSIRWTPETSFKGITDKDYDAWELAYPAVVIDQELEKANQWLLGNPTKAKKKQWRKFITGWLGRAQERGGR